MPCQRSISAQNRTRAKAAEGEVDQQVNRLLPLTEGPLPATAKLGGDAGVAKRGTGGGLGSGTRWVSHMRERRTTLVTALVVATLIWDTGCGRAGGVAPRGLADVAETNGSASDGLMTIGAGAGVLHRDCYAALTRARGVFRRGSLRRKLISCRICLRVRRGRHLTYFGHRRRC
jgi:hypothetical protein